MPQQPTGFVPDGFQPDTDQNGQPSAAMRFASELYNKSPIPAAIGLVKGATNAALHPLDTFFGLKPAAETVVGLAKAQWDEAVKAAQKAKEATQGGGALSATEAFGHGLAAVLPILGPAAADVGEHFAKGDTAGGFGGGMALLAPFAAKYGLELKGAANPQKADLLRREAEQQVSERVLGPANPRYKSTAQTLAPEVLQRGMQGSRLELQQLADEGMAKAADQIDTAVSAMPQPNVIDVKSIANDLQQRIDSFKVNGSVIPTAAERVKHLEQLKSYLQKNVGDTASFDDVKRIRDEFYQAADAAKGYQQSGNQSIADAGWAAREAGSAIRSALAKDRPELVAPNADYTFFKRLGDVLDPAIGRPKTVIAAPTGVTGGLSTAGAIIGQAAASTPGMKAVSALVMSRILPALKEAQISPAWRCRRAGLMRSGPPHSRCMHDLRLLCAIWGLRGRV